MLYGFAASVALRVEASKEFDPCSSTLVATVGPGLPRSLLNVSVYILREAVGEGVKVGAVVVIGNFNLPEVN